MLAALSHPMLRVALVTTGCKGMRLLPNMKSKCEPAYVKKTVADCRKLVIFQHGVEAKIINREVKIA
jgi:hypothetical protein